MSDSFDSDGAGREMAEKEGWTVPIDRERLEGAIDIISKIVTTKPWAQQEVIAAARAHLATLPAPPERNATLRELIDERGDKPLWRLAALARLDELEAKVPKEEKKRATVGLSEMSDTLDTLSHEYDGPFELVRKERCRYAAAVLRAAAQFREKWGEPNIVKSARRELSMLEQDALALLKKLP